MVSLLKQTTRKRVVVKEGHKIGAQLLSMRQVLTCHASIGIDTIEKNEGALSRSKLNAITGPLRQLLYVEFGRHRVHRYREAFAVSHHCLETLIGGLLRVQFHARQLDVGTSLSTDQCNEGGLPVSWGVGGTIAEAENERLQRYRHKHS